MTLAIGTKLGPYEILSPLGAGGMGEVYRAKDTRLGREVAIKVLPTALSRDADRMRRFEKEARAASALTHPNIVTIHDVMDGDSGLCIVMELVSGRTLREVLAEGPLAPKKWLGIASQTAEGLARAHASGIVHRDLKPENLMISDDGLVKILDFGLAKLTQPEEASGATQAPTVSGGTEPGIVMGTVGYMSPEQARGKALDFRSDQFSLGSIAYEMATGRRAFSRESTPETLSAIIREEPEPMGAAAPQTPPPARWIVERCLAKDPQQRYASTQDLARDLASVRDHLSELSVSGPVVPPPVRRSRALVIGLAGALALAGVAGILAGRRMASTHPPSFKTLTYRRGWIQSARFAPDGQSVVYSAAWDGKPARLFLKRPDSPDEVAIPLPSANILAISKSGEMAIALDCRSTHASVCSGSLARASITGGAPRPVADDAQQADWAPDGESLVVARDVGGRGRLEFPLGKVLYETAGHTSYPRLSPKADWIAFVDHPLKTDNRGSVAIMDLAGHRRTLTREWAAIESLAWSPAGDEIWFTGFGDDGPSSSALYAVSLTGRERTVARFPAGIRIQDVSRSGRLLITQDTDRCGISGRVAGESRERDLSWLNWSVVRDISRDGKMLLFGEEGGLPGPDYATCIRGMDGSPVVRLGDGAALALSPDGKWAVAQLSQAGFPLVLLSTRTGERRILPTGGIHADEVEWVDERRIAFVGSAPGRPMQLYVQDIGEGGPRAISTESVEGDNTSRIAPSPDGRVVAAVGPDHKCRLYPIAGGAARSIPGIAEGEFPQVWSADGRWLYVRGPQVSEPPARLFRVEPETGRREVRQELIPADPAGLVVIGQVVVAPDGESYAYSYGTSFSRLLVAEGIK